MMNPASLRFSGFQRYQVDGAPTYPDGSQDWNETWAFLRRRHTNAGKLEILTDARNDTHTVVWGEHLSKLNSGYGTTPEFAKEIAAAPVVKINYLA